MVLAWDRAKERSRAFRFEKQGDGVQTIKMEQMGEISGRVALPAGHTMDEVKLSLDFKGPNGVIMEKGPWSSEIGDDGNFLISRVPVGVELNVRATVEGFEGFRPNIKYVRIGAGQVVDVGAIGMERTPDPSEPSKAP